MPLLQISTNVNIENQEEFSSNASSLVAKILGKPESYVMIAVNAKANLMFAGSNEPAAHLQLKSLGLPEDKTSAFSASLCGFMEEQLSIPPARTYIEFSNPARHLWGWDNRTF